MAVTRPLVLNHPESPKKKVALMRATACAGCMMSKQGAVSVCWGGEKKKVQMKLLPEQITMAMVVTEAQGSPV